MKLLRTPDSRFEDLPDFNYEPNYVEISGIRVHYLDEGEPDAKPVLLMHGEPSWSYLYRKMIPPLVKSGYRVIVPDLPGFGRSDKPSSRKDYSYQMFVDLFTEFVDLTNISNAALFVQDWGGLIGLRVLAEKQTHFSHVIAANTGLPSASGFKGVFGYFLYKLQVRLKGKVTEEQLLKDTNFVNWVAFSQTVEKFDVGKLIQGATVTDLTEDIIRGYDAPFPDESYKEGVRAMPMLVASQLRKNHQVWEKVLRNWKKPFLTLFSDMDPLTRGGEKPFKRRIPGAANQPHETIQNAGHFLQEDKGEELSKKIIDFLS